MKTKKRALLFLLLGTAALAGCELIVDFDRTKIPVDAVDAVAPTGDASQTDAQTDAATDATSDATTDATTDATSDATTDASDGGSTDGSSDAADAAD
jgi:hypothetical protein